VDLKLQRVICGNTLVVNNHFWLTGNVIWLDVEQMKIHFFLICKIAMSPTLGTLRLLEIFNDCFLNKCGCYKWYAQRMQLSVEKIQRNCRKTL